MLVGYVGADSTGQSLEIQLRTLSDAGCAKVFSEEQNWMCVGARNALQRALDFVREGDTLVVTRIDQVSRLANDVQNLIARLRNRDVDFRCLEPICSEETYLTVSGLVSGLTVSGRRFPAEGKAVHCLFC